MKIRNKFWFKSIAVFLAIQIMNMVIVPSIVLGQNSGPTSPEAAAFEPVDATDMVNLITGDVSYVLPLLDVPSPEGGYPISLSYHGGITIDQEASWVGLGWNINPGAINRNVHGYPDDWKKKDVWTILSDPGGSVSNTNLSFGASLGKIGSVGLSFSWGDNKAFGGSVQYGAGIKGTPFGINGSIGEYTGVGVGTRGSTVNIGANVGYDVNSGKSGVGLSANNYAGGISFSSFGGQNNLSIGGVSLSSQNVSAGDWHTYYKRTGASLDFFYGNISYEERTYYNKLYKRGIAKVFGPLYFSESYEPTSQPLKYGNGVINLDYEQDVYTAQRDGYHFNDSNKDKATKNDFMFPAYDKYSVSAQGLSGSMTPHILQFGQLFKKYHAFDGHNPTNDHPLGSERFEEIYYMQGTQRVDKPANSIYFNFDYSATSYLKIDAGQAIWKGQPNENDPAWDFTTTSTLSANSPIGGKSFYNSSTKRKGDGKYVEWFKNADIQNGVAASKGFIETPSITESRTNTNYFDPEGIGAYSVTVEDGKTYHYSLPVYQYEEIYRDNMSSGAVFEQRKLEKYAYSWLLTAITGPDYIDINNDGMVNEGDYGYWVNMDYGKWTDGYLWKTPYNNEPGKTDFFIGRKQIYYLNTIKTRTHTAYFIKDLREDGLSRDFNDNKPFSIPINYTQAIPSDFRECSTNATPIDYLTCSTVLETIRYTREFIININAPQKHKVLKLSKIILVKNEDATLSTINPTGSSLISNPGATVGSMTITEILKDIVTYTSNQCLNPVHLENRSEVYCRTSYSSNFSGNYQNNVLDVKDFDFNTFKEKAIKVIDFNHKHDLFTGSPNSNAPSYIDPVNSHGPLSTSYASGGKLALSEVVFNGKGGVNVLPSYKFKYYHNHSSYGFFNADNWGFEKYYPYANSLQEILTPVGSKIKFTYESDNYSSTAIGSQAPPYKSFLAPLDAIYRWNPSATQINLTFDPSVNLREYFIVGNFYQFQVNIASNSLSNTAYPACKNSYKVLGIDVNLNNRMSVEIPIYYAIETCIDAIMATLPPGFDRTEIEGHPIYIVASGVYTNYSNYSGGGIRAKTIEIEDELGNRYETEYDYSSPLTGATSGITSYVPTPVPVYIPYANDIPGPGVMYEYVTVKQKGLLETPASQVTYHFEVLQKSADVNAVNFSMGSHFQVQNQEPNDRIWWNLGTNGSYMANHKHSPSTRKVLLINNTAALGRLLSITAKDEKGLMAEKITYKYKDMSSMGQGITQESFRYTKRNVEWDNVNHVTSNSLWSLNTSSKIDYSSILESVTTTSKGQVKTILYDEYDFNTGKPLKTKYEDSWGNVYRTKVVPAYNVWDFYGYKPYAKMGSKVDNITNKNMLVQDAETYLFAGDNDNTVSAAIQTWSNDWSYRTYDVPNFNYTDVSETIESKKVWRKHQNYVWKTNVGTNGTFGVDEDAPWNWTVGATQDVRWKKVNEITKYNHYSQPLESTDIVGKYASTKMGYNDARVITTAVNTKYTDFAFSGAEDEVINNHFGGEVLKGGGSTIGTKYIHTGTKSLYVPDGEFGFVYRYYNHDVNKKYKASVWVRKEDHAEIRLAAIMKQGGFGGTTLQYITSRVIPSVTKEAGNWYLLELEIPNATEDPSILNSDYLEVQLYNPSGLEPFSIDGISIVDDFMVHPITAPMTSYVYDDETGLVTAIIDNNGMATKYAYDAAGKLIATYKEVLNKGFVKTAEYNYNYAR